MVTINLIIFILYILVPQIIIHYINYKYDIIDEDLTGILTVGLFTVQLVIAVGILEYLGYI